MNSNAVALHRNLPFRIIGESGPVNEMVNVQTVTTNTALAGKSGTVPMVTVSMI